MKINIIGITGSLGRRLINEALERGHEVTGVAPDADTAETDKRVSIVKGDAGDVVKLSQQLRGADIVITVFPPSFEYPGEYPQAVSNVIEAVKKAEGPRLLGVVGSSSALVNTGERLVDTDYFDETNRHFYYNICDSWEVYKREKTLDWAVIVPAANMQFFEEKKLGSYRKGKDHIVVTDPDTKQYFDVSKISYADFAYAIMDEVEQHNHSRERFTVGY